MLAECECPAISLQYSYRSRLPLNSAHPYGVRLDDVFDTGPIFSSDSIFLRISGNRLSGGIDSSAAFAACRHDSLAFSSS